MNKGNDVSRVYSHRRYAKVFEYVLHFAISLTILRDFIIVIISIEFKTNLKMYAEIIWYLAQV